jgi:hypothetical protein
MYVLTNVEMVPHVQQVSSAIVVCVDSAVLVLLQIQTQVNVDALTLIRYQSMLMVTRNVKHVHQVKQLVTANV